MARSGSANNFPPGQCTWWASQRYYQLTGKYVPMTGDAWSWASGAQAAGWNVSSTPPPAGTPAIVVLQPNVQGAGGLGHVAIAEQINSGGVSSSNLNWAGNQTTVTQVSFRNGTGVQYVWYPGAGRLAGAPNVVYGAPATQAQGVGVGKGASGAAPGFGTIGGNAGGQVGGTIGGNAGRTSSSTGGTSSSSGGTSSTGGAAALGTLAGYIPLLTQVHITLTSNQGMYGVALAVDEAEKFPGWVNLATNPADFIGLTRSIGASISDNFPPLLIRGGLFLLGLTICGLLCLKALSESKLAPLVGLA